MATHRLCAVEGCGKPHHAHGYCSRHAARFRAHGDPLGGRHDASPGEPMRWIQENSGYRGDDCLRWPFEVSRYGYGCVKFRGKRTTASRVMCEVAHGPPPEIGYDAAHSCGNGHKACMNPRHLRWASRLSNVSDAIDHGTYWRGRVKTSETLAKANGMTPVTEGMVRGIRALQGHMIYKDIAAKFGVSTAVVGKIIRRERWAWVDD